MPLLLIILLHLALAQNPHGALHPIVHFSMAIVHKNYTIEAHAFTHKLKLTAGAVILFCDQEDLPPIRLSHNGFSVVKNIFSMYRFCLLLVNHNLCLDPTESK